MAVTDAHLRSCVKDDFRYLSIIDARRREHDGTQLSLKIDGGMQLEPVVPTLMILPEVCNVLGDTMGIRSVQLADGEHRGIPDFDGIIGGEERLQEPVHDRGDAMAVREEAPVLREMRKVLMQVQPRERAKVFDGLLVQDECIPDEERHQLSVGEDRRTTSECMVCFWQEIIYQAKQVDDMIRLQGEHSERGRREEPFQSAGSLSLAHAVSEVFAFTVAEFANALDVEIAELLNSEEHGKDNKDR
jgi:hypothetical protein